MIGPHRIEMEATLPTNSLEATHAPVVSCGRGQIAGGRKSDSCRGDCTEVNRGTQQIGVVVGLNLGGSVNPVFNAVSVVELAVEKGASLILMPVSSRKQLFELSDDMATKIDVQFYTDAREALLKALAE